MEDGCVEEVLEVSSTEPNCSSSLNAQVNPGNFYFLGEMVQNLLSSFDIWKGNSNDFIKPSRSLHSWVKALLQVGSSNDDNTVILPEPIHFCQ